MVSERMRLHPTMLSWVDNEKEITEEENIASLRKPQLYVRLSELRFSGPIWSADSARQCEQRSPSFIANHGQQQ
jgi:hypothetical protein